ncbi:MAG TPA: quinolinate synthase [Candidatus Marinimicrobia bacterium]|nr:quinolinate synthase [Candidatus Neomarinimicrobiota bacterium]
MCMETFEKGVENFKPSRTQDQILADIRTLKHNLSHEMILLAHHYQQDEIIALADVVGDSLKLAQKAAKIRNKKYIVFAGVHFMAESADILTPSDRVVLLPEPKAGCPLAEMADITEVESVWRALKNQVKGKIIPVTYINSTAVIKAFVGRNGGTVCTSGNAGKIFDWAFEQGDKILFLPDRYLGENTALAKGIPPELIYHLKGDMLNPVFQEDIHTAKVLLWDGYCSVHRRFRPEDVTNIRKKHPGVRVIVHPECSHDVVAKADDSGSTEKILHQVEQSKAGSVWAVGTEAHMVNRLQEMFPDKTILQLKNPGYQCVTMSMTTPEKLHHVLSELSKGHVIHQVKVKQDIARDAYTALNKMLDITG